MYLLIFLPSFLYEQCHNPVGNVHSFNRKLYIILCFISKAPADELFKFLFHVFAVEVPYTASELFSEVPQVYSTVLSQPGKNIL